MRAMIAVPLFLAAAAFSAPDSRGAAGDLACRPSGQPPTATGVVLLHGKGALSVDVKAPGGYGNTGFEVLRKKIEQAGFRAVLPELPWSTSREYDRTYRESLDEIGVAVSALKQQGARRIVLVGHSMGGNAAVGYAGLRAGVAGVVVLSPGHVPDVPGFAKIVEPSVAKARQMMAAGQGDQITTFRDVVPWGEKNGDLLTTPRHFISYFDPKGEAVMPKNVIRFAKDVALLWIIGAQDEEGTSLGKGYAFDKAPANPLNRYIVVPGGHVDVPTNGADYVVGWLRCL